MVLVGVEVVVMILVVEIIVVVVVLVIGILAKLRTDRYHRRANSPAGICW